MSDMGDRQPGTGRVLLDTSIQIERHKVARKSNPVEATIGEYPWTATSTFARLEFKRAWIKPLALIYTKSHEYQSLGDLQEAVADAYPRARNSEATARQALNAYLARLPKTTSLEQAVARLRAHLEVAIEGFADWWAHSIQREFCGTGCVRALEEVRIDDRGHVSATISKCRPGKTNCDISRFFKAHAFLFALIEKEIEENRQEASHDLLVFADTIRRAQKEPDILQDDRACSALADCIIAIDGIETDSFAANNPAEWPTIAKALGKQLLNPVAEAKRPK